MEIIANSVGDYYLVSKEHSLPSRTISVDLIKILITDAKGTHISMPLNIVKDELESRITVIKRRKMRISKAIYPMVNKMIEKEHLDDLSMNILRNKISWDNPPEVEHKQEDRGGCTISCCCWQHCSIVHIPNVFQK